MRLAQSAQDPFLLSVAHDALGRTLYYFGELTAARLHVEQALALYDCQTHPHPTIATSNLDLRPDCLSYAAWTLSRLGYPDQALKRSQEAVTLARGLSHPLGLASALGFAALFHLQRREEQLARERAEAVITLGTEQGFPHWVAWGTLVQGWALAEQGQVREGIAQMRQSQVSSLVPNVLAEAYGKMGQVEEGLTVLTEALAFVDKTGLRVLEAELYRLKGTLTLQKEARGWRLETSPPSSQASSPKPQVSSGAEQEAEGYFLKAIEIARQQQAKS
jgi:tetratricopeptide (TPR) repeat protein